MRLQTSSAVAVQRGRAGSVANQSRSAWRYRSASFVGGSAASLPPASRGRECHSRAGHGTPSSRLFLRRSCRSITFFGRVACGRPAVVERGTITSAGRAVVAGSPPGLAWIESQAGTCALSRSVGLPRSSTTSAGTALIVTPGDHLRLLPPLSARFRHASSLVMDTGFVHGSRSVIQAESHDTSVGPDEGRHRDSNGLCCRTSGGFPLPPHRGGTAGQASQNHAPDGRFWDRREYHREDLG